MITRFDKFIITFFLILSAAFFLAFSFIGKNGNKVLNIYSDGKLYATYNLDDIKKPFEEEIANDNGVVTVFVSDEMCYVKEADCPDKLCIRQRPINKVNQTITCLPAKILLEIVSEKSEEKVDMVAF